MRVALLVTGSRYWTDPEPIRALLAALPPRSVVLHGAARGADAIADRLALEMRIHVRAFAADWTNDGKAAGPIRNRRMLGHLIALRSEGYAIRVAAFPLRSSRGTWDMVQIARAAGVEVVVHGEAGR